MHRGVPDIVIYEGDQLTRGLLEEWLAEERYRVRIGNLLNAADDGPCDLLIVSVCMPKQGGVQHLRGIQAAHPDTPVIAISGHFRPGLAASGSAAQTLQVAYVVAKPLSRDQLMASVRGILKH